MKRQTSKTKSQRDRFIDAAREAGASEDEAVFDENLRRVTEKEKDDPRLRRRQFAFNKRSFEVRAALDDGGWHVRVFEDDKPATTMVYHASWNTIIGAKHSFGVDAAEHLMQTAQIALERGWDRLLKP
jgi:hypothetical protein